MSQATATWHPGCERLGLRGLGFSVILLEVVVIGLCGIWLLSAIWDLGPAWSCRVLGALHDSHVELVMIGEYIPSVLVPM